MIPTNARPNLQPAPSGIQPVGSGFPLPVATPVEQGPRDAQYESTMEKLVRNAYRAFPVTIPSSGKSAILEVTGKSLYIVPVTFPASTSQQVLMYVDDNPEGIPMDLRIRTGTIALTLPTFSGAITSGASAGDFNFAPDDGVFGSFEFSHAYGGMAIDIPHRRLQFALRNTAVSGAVIDVVSFANPPNIRVYP